MLKKKKIRIQYNTITEIQYKKYNNRNTLEGTKSRLDDAKEGINDLEDRLVEITQLEQQQKKKNKKIEDGFRDLWDNIKNTTFAL